MFRNVFGGCVSDRSSQAEVFRSQKLKFGASLSSALKHGYLPGPLVDILVYIAKEGVATADVFRRPGNPNDTRRIVKRLTEGKQVIYSNYSFYTLASVVKKFLLKIPGGVFTPEGEEQLLEVLTLHQRMEQIEAVHTFMETLTPAHQQLVALLFGTWFRIVTFSEVNCMSVEALSRSVAGSMFHTCAEDPAKVEKASRIMQFLIDNFGVEAMFGKENIRFFVETTHTGIHIRELYRFSYCPDSQLIPRKQVERVFLAFIEKEATKYGFDPVANEVRPDFIEVTRMEGKKGEHDEDDEEDGGLGHEREFSESPEPSLSALCHAELSHDTSAMEDDEQMMINMSTLSAPEVSLVPSPEVSKRPKSLEDNLNEVRSHYQSRCLSRFNSVKRKQLERLRQRSDWFLSPTVRERNNSRKGRGEGSLSLFASHGPASSGQGGGGSGGKSGDNENNNNNSNTNNNLNGSSKVLQQKNSGNSVVTKASSEGAVLEAFSDGDSVFTDNTSRSESPASEPVWSHILKVHSRDIIHSDTIAELALPEMSLYGGGSGAELSLGSQEGLSVTDLSTTSGAAPASPALSSSVAGEERVEGHDGDEEDDEDDDDDNTTPTGLQEEEDTLQAVSLQDINTPSPEEDSEEISIRAEELDKDMVATDMLVAAADEAKLKQSGGKERVTPPQDICSEDGSIEIRCEQDGRLNLQGQQTREEDELKDGDVRGTVDVMNKSSTSGVVEREEEEERQNMSSSGMPVAANSPEAEQVVKCFLVEHQYGDNDSDEDDDALTKHSS